MHRTHLFLPKVISRPLNNNVFKKTVRGLAGGATSVSKKKAMRPIASQKLFAPASNGHQIINGAIFYRSKIL